VQSRNNDNLRLTEGNIRPSLLFGRSNESIPRQAVDSISSSLASSTYNLFQNDNGSISQEKDAGIYLI